MAISREFPVSAPHLNIPVAFTREKMTRLELWIDGTVARVFDVPLATADPDYWVHLDVTSYLGAQARIVVASPGDGGPPADAVSPFEHGLANVHLSEHPERLDGAYDERLRPRVHFTARRGWINDPNGLVFYRGEYHLFFQHNPYSAEWGNMHWGHAVSSDLIHWHQLDEALYPDPVGVAFSGSCVVDSNNTSGLGTDGESPLVAIFTRAFFPTPAESASGALMMERQCVAWSTDRGRTWTTRPDPLIGDQRAKLGTHNSRDPYVFWYEPGEHWVMVLFERLELVIYTSSNLLEWHEESRFGSFWECPCMFPLAVDGQSGNRKWVVHGAVGDYLIGTFDGRSFTPESGPHNYLRGHLYAAQSFNAIPEDDGRRIQMGWAHIRAPRMPFAGMMGVPTELTLRSTFNGILLFCNPVEELASLHRKHATGSSLNPAAAAGLLRPLNAECLHLVLELENISAMSWGLDLGGDTLIYSLHDNAFFFNERETYLGEKIAQLRYLPPVDRRSMRLEIVLDRMSIEVFIDDGRFVMVLPRTDLSVADHPGPDIPTADAPRFRPIDVFVDPEGEILIRTLDAWELASIWDG